MFSQFLDLKSCSILFMHFLQEVKIEIKTHAEYKKRN